MLEPIACPECRYEFNLLEAFSDNADQRAVEQFMQATFPIPDRLMHYFALFTPDKQRLTIRKQLRLMREVSPDLSRQAITRAGRDWHAPIAAWAKAIDTMLARRSAGTLTLPLKNHGYLHTILVDLAEKAEASAERQREADARNTPRRDSVQVRGQPLSIGEALQVVHGHKDPALAKLDDDTRKAAPMPDQMRERIAQIKRGEA